MSFSKIFNLSWLFFCLFDHSALATTTIDQSTIDATDAKISALLNAAPIDKDQRLNFFSEKLLGIRFKFRTWGEGPNADIQAAPLYQLNSLDCVTFTELVLSLTQAKDLKDFQKKVIQIRYKKEPVNFINRNHFMETDWIPNALNKKFLIDITNQLFKEQTKDLAASIDKPNWLKKINLDTIQPLAADRDVVVQRLFKLSEQASIENFKLHYVPHKLLTEETNLKKIPPGTIVVFIYNPFPQMLITYGTPSYVRHAGLIIKKTDELLLRSTSSIKKQRFVGDRNLLDYLKKEATDSDFLGAAFYQIK